MSDTNNEQSKDTSKKEHKSSDYVTRVDLEAALAKFLKPKNTKEALQNNDKSEVVASIVNERHEKEKVKEIERNLEIAYENRDRLNKIVENLSEHATDQDFFKEIVKRHAARNYNSEVDRLNYTTKDIVTEFFNNQEFVKYLSVTDSGTNLKFTNLSETDKLQKSTEYLDVINRALQRINDLKNSKVKAEGANISDFNNEKYLQKYLRVRENVDYYKLKQQGV